MRFFLRMHAYLAALHYILPNCLVKRVSLGLFFVAALGRTKTFYLFGFRQILNIPYIYFILSTTREYKYTSSATNNGLVAILLKIGIFFYNIVNQPRARYIIFLKNYVETSHGEYLPFTIVPNDRCSA